MGFIKELNDLGKIFDFEKIQFVPIIILWFVIGSFYSIQNFPDFFTKYEIFTKLLMIFIYGIPTLSIYMVTTLGTIIFLLPIRYHILMKATHKTFKESNAKSIEFPSAPTVFLFNASILFLIGLHSLFSNIAVTTIVLFIISCSAGIISSEVESILNLKKLKPKTIDKTIKI
ncbi:MAG: hypothetical protein WA139_04840 [Candidatus Aenigmatarchaeota archaeon]